MILFRVSREAFLPFLIFSFFAGILFSAIYDVFRIRRIAFRRSYRKRSVRSADAIIIFFEDIVFSLFIAVTLILICYKLYFGIPRWYSFAAAALGFCLWRITAGALIMKLSDKIISAVASFLAFVKRKVIMPPIGVLSGFVKKRLKVYRSRSLIKQTDLYEKRALSALKGK